MQSTTADLADEFGDRIDSCATQFRQFGGHRLFSGVILTLRCGDSALVERVLDEPADGRVLVVDGGGSLDAALFGERAARRAVANGWAGMVVHGAVRDTGALAALGLGVKALGTNPRLARTAGAGERNVPVSFGGIIFTPGAFLWSDDDGVLTKSPQ